MSEQVDKQVQMEMVVTRFIQSPPLAMYDIGVGPKTEWDTLRRRYPDMRLCGCEPLVDCYPGLVQRFPGRLLRVAISRQERLMLHFNPQDMKTASASKIQEATQMCQVPAWTLDRFDKEMGAPKRILLWMDIEGGELEALRSGEALLRSHRVRWINLEERTLTGETPLGWCTGNELKSFLEAFGYVRAWEYNRHRGHQDVLYFYRDEPLSKAGKMLLEEKEQRGHKGVRNSAQR